jgi:nucleoside-diphosphate-sugar epimerase
MTTTTADVPVPSTAVVTGASGWLGQNLVRALAPARDRVRCLVPDDHAAVLLEVVSASVESVVGDVRDPAALDRLIDAVPGATVFHAAGVVHPRHGTRELFDVNAGGTELLVDRARRGRAGRFVHVSSNSPFGANPSPDHVFGERAEPNPYMAYGRSKLEAERLVLRAHERGDIEAAVVRPPWFYGPFQPSRQTQWLRAVRRGRFPLVGDGRNRRSMAYTGNLVHGLLRAEVAAAAPGRAWWIADRHPYEMRDVLATVRQALRAEGLSVAERQPRLPRTVALAAERADAVVQSRGRYLQALHVLGELDDTIACDVAPALAELDYDPAVSLLDGMRQSIRWCLERGHRL